MHVSECVVVSACLNRVRNGDDECLVPHGRECFLGYFALERHFSTAWRVRVCVCLSVCLCVRVCRRGEYLPLEGSVMRTTTNASHAPNVSILGTSPLCRLILIPPPLIEYAAAAAAAAAAVVVVGAGAGNAAAETSACGDVTVIVEAGDVSLSSSSSPSSRNPRFFCGGCCCC